MLEGAGGCCADFRLRYLHHIQVSIRSRVPRGKITHALNGQPFEQSPPPSEGDTAVEISAPSHEGGVFGVFGVIYGDGGWSWKTAGAVYGYRGGGGVGQSGEEGSSCGRCVCDWPSPPGSPL